MTVQNGEYILADADFESELERIRLLERLYDPTTALSLDAAGIQPGWRCLEVGAGGGSVARLLADRVGPTGKVVALDMNTRFLNELGDPIEVRESDIRCDPVDDGYDLVHTRFVLMHLPGALDVVAKLVGALKPGGVFVFEEGDFTSMGPLDDTSPYAAGARRAINGAAATAEASAIFDPFAGRRLAGAVEGAAGLAFTEIFRGGTENAAWHAVSLSKVRPLAVTASTATEADFDALTALLADNRVVFQGLTRVAVTGCRAA